MPEQSDSAANGGLVVAARQLWFLVAAGGLLGAVVSLAVAFGAGWLGYFPGASDARIHNYLMAHPRVLYDMARKAEADQAEDELHQRQAAIDKLGMKRFFSPAVAYVTGPANAKNTFVEFFDYNCGHCRNTFPTVLKFYKAHKNDTRFAFIDFPIFGADSTGAARAAVASRRQGDLYLALHFLLMGEAGPINTELLYADAQKAGLDVTKLSADVMDPNVDRTIAAAHKLAEEAQASGTPMFIVNGKVHEGEITETELNALLKS